MSKSPVVDKWEWHPFQQNSGSGGRGMERVPPRRLLFWYDKFNYALTAWLFHCLGTFSALTSWLLENCLAFMLALWKAVLCPGCLLFCSAQWSHWPPGSPIIQCPEYVGWISRPYPIPHSFQLSLNKESALRLGKRAFPVLIPPQQAFCAGLNMSFKLSRILFLFNMRKGEAPLSYKF